MRTATDWTPALIERLTQLWSDGLTCSEIALQIPGTTRSSCIGKIHRLGLPGRPSPVRASGSAPRKRPPPAVKPPSFPEPILEVIEPLHMDLMAIRDGQCRFPYGNSNFTFCGHPIKPGKPYCGFHSAATSTGSQPIMRDRKDAAAEMERVSGVARVFR
jgi:GcrA cell cycle regulator